MSQSQTTRQHRRVVWITTKVLLTIGLLFVAGRMFLLRGTLLAMAPAETDIAVSFVGERALTGFFDHLEESQAITDHPLSFSELQPYVGREMALFIDLETQTQSVAFQGSLSEEIKGSWSNYGITVEESSGVITLSATSLEFQQKNTNLKFASLLPNYAGEVLLQEERGALFLHKDGILAKVHTGVDMKETNFEVDIETVAVLPIEWTEWKELGPEATGAIQLRVDELGTAFFLQIDQGFESQTLAKIVQKIALLQRPAVELIALPDQTSARELRLDDALFDVNIEELEQGVRVTAKSDRLNTIMGWVEGDKTFLTNREVLLTGNSKEKSNSTCLKSGIVYLFPKKISVPSDLLGSFQEVAVSKEKVKLCW